MTSTTVIVPTCNGGARLRRLLRSLEPSEAQIVVIDNGSTDGTGAMLRREFPTVELVALPSNHGFARAVNAGAARAEGRALVLLNDDCVCDPGFVTALAAALEPGRDVVMAAAVLREARDPGLIDSAGMALDPTLLVFDYLNGEPVSALEGEVADPVGPSAAAAAFDTHAFLELGGFDENLFAYWEDVDLVLRLRQAGGQCVLAKAARGTHEHSATLGSGSAAKNYLTGFGRGYLLRKWSVLTPARAPGVAARELAICAGQALIDRNTSGVRGRIEGFAAARRVEPRPYPAGLLEPAVGGTLMARARRRRRLRARLREAA